MLQLHDHAVRLLKRAPGMLEHMLGCLLKRVLLLLLLLAGRQLLLLFVLLARPCNNAQAQAAETWHMARARSQQPTLLLLVVVRLQHDMVVLIQGLPLRPTHRPQRPLSPLSAARPAVLGQHTSLETVAHVYVAILGCC